MAQYCRYCANMVSGDANYCDVKQRTFTDAQKSRCKASQKDGKGESTKE